MPRGLAALEEATALSCLVLSLAAYPTLPAQPHHVLLMFPHFNESMPARLPAVAVGGAASAGDSRPHHAQQHSVRLSPALCADWLATLLPENSIRQMTQLM